MSSSRASSSSRDGAVAGSSSTSIAPNFDSTTRSVTHGMLRRSSQMSTTCSCKLAVMTNVLVVEKERPTTVTIVVDRELRDRLERAVGGSGQRLERSANECHRRESHLPRQHPDCSGQSVRWRRAQRDWRQCGWRVPAAYRGQPDRVGIWTTLSARRIGGTRRPASAGLLLHVRLELPLLDPQVVRELEWR